MAPRAIRAPVPRVPYDLAAGGGRVAAALAAFELDVALGAAAEMVVVARGDALTLAAVAAVFDHLARYPLSRSPALGAFVAALTEQVP